jgi:ribosomal protein S7
LPTSEKLMFTQQQILVKESRIQQKSKVVPAKLFPIAKQQSLKSKLKHQPQPHVIAGKLPGSKHRFVKAKMVSKPLLIGATNSSNAGPSIIARNIKFYNAADGVYNSFWVGKFINYFIRKGKKKTAIKLFHSTLLQLKLTNGTLPLINIIEALEQIRPSFRLSPWYRSGKQILYPKVVSRSNQYRLAARWLYEYIVDHRRESSEDKRKRLEGNKKAKKRAKRDKQLKGVIVKKPVKQEKERQVHINEDLPTRLYSKLIEFKQHRRHPLLKKRDALHVNVIRWQENIRYTWRS